MGIKCKPVICEECKCDDCGSDCYFYDSLRLFIMQQDGIKFL